MRLLACLLLLLQMGSRAAPDTASCRFTVRLGGELVAIDELPDQERYIVSCWSLEKRQELLDRISVGAPELQASLEPLTTTMPFLVGNLSRTMLQWLCQDPQASAAIEYVEEDQKVSLA